MSKMVTRTVVSTKATCMVANLESKTLEEVTVSIAGTYDDENKLIKAIKKAHGITVCAIVKSIVFETLYGLEENQFMSMAVELDPTTRKPINQ